MKNKTIWLGLLALLLLWPAATAFADQPTWQFDGGQIYTDEDVQLQPGQTFVGDLGVFNGDLEMPAGSTVNGDVFVANGDATIAGRVNGDVAVIRGDLDLTSAGWVAGDVFGLSGQQDISGHVRGSLSAVFGDMVLRSSAIVEGDLLVAPGNIERQAGAQVLGDEVHDLRIPQIPVFPERPGAQEMPQFTPPEVPLPDMPRLTPPAAPHPVLPQRPTVGSRIGHFVGRLFSAGFLSLAFVALGLLVVFVWPRASRRVADCLAALPLQSLGLGLLTFLIAAGVEALAAVLMIVLILVGAALIGTVILIPIGLLLILLSALLLLPVPLALVAAMVLGWVGLSELVGNRLLKVLKATDVKPLGATLIGLLLTVSVAATLWLFTPVCCGWPFVILLTSWGLGAVVHTRFGRESCRPSQPAGTAAAADEPLPADAMDEEAGQPDVPPAP